MAGSGACLLWSGEASVACDDVVGGTAGIGLFGSDFCVTQRCRVDVFRLLHDNDSVLVACTSLDTGAEHSMKISAQEWALLGYRPLASSCTKDHADACIYLSGCLRVISTGRLRVEAARQLLFRGVANIGSGDGAAGTVRAMCHVWEAMPPAIPGSRTQPDLIVKAVEVGFQEAPGGYVIRIPSEALGQLRPQGLRGRIGSEPPEVADAICAALFSSLRFDHGGGKAASLHFCAPAPQGSPAPSVAAVVCSRTNLMATLASTPAAVPALRLAAAAAAAAAETSGHSFPREGKAPATDAARSRDGARGSSNRQAAATGPRLCAAYATHGPLEEAFEPLPLRGRRVSL